MLETLRISRRKQLLLSLFCRILFSGRCRVCAIFRLLSQLYINALTLLWPIFSNYHSFFFLVLSFVPMAFRPWRKRKKRPGSYTQLRSHTLSLPQAHSSPSMLCARAKKTFPHANSARFSLVHYLTPPSRSVNWLLPHAGTQIPKDPHQSRRWKKPGKIGQRKIQKLVTGYSHVK